jgi:hypothetical protein
MPTLYDRVRDSDIYSITPGSELQKKLEKPNTTGIIMKPDKGYRVIEGGGVISDYTPGGSFRAMTIPTNEFAGNSNQGLENTTPYSIIEQNLADLKTEYRGIIADLEKQSEGADPGQVRAIFNRHQQAYNQKKAAILEGKNQLGMIDKLEAEGQIDSAGANKARWGLVVPPDVHKEMFPTVRADTKFSIAQMKQIIGGPAKDKETGGIVLKGPIAEWSNPSNIPVEPANRYWFTKRENEPRTQEQLITQYQGAIEQVESDVLGMPMTNTQREQFDTAWDAKMKDYPNYQWDPNSGEIQALRARGPLSMAGGKQISPFGKHLMNYPVENQGIPDERKPAATPAATIPPKPAEYPDAVWNEQHQMWTVVKNGKLIGLRNK